MEDMSLKTGSSYMCIFWCVYWLHDIILGYGPYWDHQAITTSKNPHMGK